MWPWRKEFWDMPIRTVVIWGAIGMLFYAVFWIGVNHGRTNQPIAEIILQALRTPLGCGGPATEAGRGAAPIVDYYTVLMGSFARQETASNLRTRLASDRINSQILAQDGLYHVVVGRFTSLSQAEAMLNKLRQKGYGQASLLRPRAPQL